MSQPLACLDGLIRLSHRQGVDVRGPLLRVLTDLYVQEPSHSREEERQYVELALRLLPDVDPPIRAAVARKLAAYPAAPAAVMAALAAEGAAEGPSMIRGDDTAAMAVALPASDAPALDRLPTTNASSSALRRHPPGRTKLGEMFLQGTPRDRAALLTAIIDGQHAQPDPAQAMTPRPGALRRLEHAALRRDRNEFARELQPALGISRRIAWRIAEDDSGELLVTAAKALGMETAMLVRVLLFLNAAIGESVERVFTLTHLYEDLSAEAVAPIIDSWREEAAARPAGRFQSVLAAEADHGTAAARGPARTAQDGGSATRRRALTPAQRPGQGTS